MSIASTIVDQLGGHGRLRAMVGADYFLELSSGVSFTFKNRHASKGSHVTVSLRSDDTYDMDFYRITGALVKRYEGVYADRLVEIFEAQTGLYLRL